jgi:uncharacterized protein YqeY
MDLNQIDIDLIAALKTRDALKVEVLRGLKTRVQNEKIAKQRDLEAPELLNLIRSEVKRRGDAQALYEQGGRQDLAKKELDEATILKAYLPPEMDEAEVGAKLDQLIANNNFIAAQFGQAMAAAKQMFGDQVSGATLSKILKDKLK